jgi:hypothetical protein
VRGPVSRDGWVDLRNVPADVSADGWCCTQDHLDVRSLRLLHHGIEVTYEGPNGVYCALIGNKIGIVSTHQNVENGRVQAHYIRLKTRECGTAGPVIDVRIPLVDPVGVGGKSAGPFVGNLIPDKDHLGRNGRSLQTVVVGSQLSPGDEMHQGREQQVTANRGF